MARGTVVGEAVVSQAATDASRAGHERTFGEKKPGQRGLWVYDERLKTCVRAEDYVPPPSKCGTTIVTGRCHEGEKAPDGTDIGTPAKRRAWMKAESIGDYDDFKSARARRSKELEARRRGEIKHDPQLRDLIGRELYKQKVIL
jgi:hypothetical protein